MHTYHKLHCTVCRSNFTTGNGWLSHLLRGYHQIKAREEVFDWDDKMMECTLLVFSRVRVDSLAILGYFSTNFQKHVVTDFVFYPERPRIGFVQFESKAKVDEIMGTQGNEGILETRIGNQLVELKRATSYGILEWLALLPLPLDSEAMVAEDPSNSNQNQTTSQQNPVSVPLVSSSTPTPSSTGRTSTKRSSTRTPVSQQMTPSLNATRTPPESRKRAEPPPPEAQKRSHNASNCISGDFSEDIDEVPLKRRPMLQATEVKDDIALERRRQTETEDGNVSSDSDCGSARLNDPMWRQYNSIRCTLAIPKQRYVDACSLSSKIEELFSDYFKKCKVFMFRNWFLKIWNRQGRADDLLFFIIDKEYTGKRRRSQVSPAINSSLITDEAYTRIFNSARGQQLLPGVAPQPSQVPYGYTYLHQPTNTIFNVISDPIVLPEVQACRLLKYLSAFDTRVKPLLVLIRWWAKVNDVHVGQNRAYTMTPDTATLDWLVIYFLCKEVGIVPSPRQVQQRAHKPLVYRNVDIGFTTDCEWAQQCCSQSAQMKKKSSSEFVVSVMTLARQFFLFCANLWKQNNCIVNLRDGEIIDRNEFLKRDGSPIIAINTNQQTNLTDVEIEMVKKLKSFSTQRPASEQAIKILHPLFPKQTLPLSAKTFGMIVSSKMSHSVSQISHLLFRHSQNKTNGSSFQLTLRQVPPTASKRKGRIVKNNVSKRNPNPPPKTRNQTSSKKKKKKGKKAKYKNKNTNSRNTSRTSS